MAQIRPFCGILPRPELAKRIAALPYDVYSRAEAKAEVEREPLSFLKIDRAETQFSDDVDMYAPQVYQKAHDLLWKMIDDGSFRKEERPCYYVYEQEMDGRKQTGLVACASVDDYQSGVIARHENTRAEKEEDRIRHVDVCDAQTGPIFLTYRYQEIIDDCMKKAKQGQPIFDFIADDKVAHRGWRIDQEDEIAKLTGAFADIPRIYIADGHHRAASAVKVAEKRRREAQANGSEPSGEYDGFLSVLFAANELCIMDYNRVVSDLNGNSQEEFLQKLEEKCDVQKSMAMEHICEGGVCRMEFVNVPCRPQKKGQVGMYLAGEWYELTFKDAFCSSHPVDGLDVAILQREILHPILGIQDPKRDARIQFVGGNRGLSELERQADAGGGVAFAMYPTSMEELLEVADAGLLMPPKSTWFEPKLRSGLFIHALK